ncbi:MAG TPA: hypothetical protein VFK02_23435 [Kofleriaceae bacterium]|nr:hypothetical protein [Kofleriaceae bacterium]
MSLAFSDPPALCGPLRRPRQMLAEQRYDGHKSIHDDRVAEGLGLRAGPIEGPTHFSQFDPLLHHLFGQAWFETGCLSAHYQTMVVEGEQVRAFVQPPPQGRRLARVWAEKRDGTPVLTGTASIDPPAAGEPTEVEQRLARLRPADRLDIYRDLRVGQNGATVERVRMAMDQHLGDSYPFTLADKLAAITEPSPWYTRDGAAGSPWRRPILPREMISVLLSSSPSRDSGLRGRGPAVGLFADQEIRLIAGPLFVDHPYELEREIIALSESPRTESMWIRTRVLDGETRAPVAEMILNHAVMKASYAAYEREAAELGRAP